MEFPRFFLVRQHLPHCALSDIPAVVKRELAASGFRDKLPAGAKVAIGVGSRGIANLAVIVRAAVDFWKAAGMQPFLFPAMGSHGAATAEGQAQVLAHFGITPSTMGCPLVSQLEVVSLGKTSDGIEAFVDREAFLSDGIMLIGRVKWHTDFIGKLESGLFKMMAIGLGKFAGARQYHTFAYKLGLEHVIRTVGRQVLRSGKILGGLAILEDAYHDTAQITAVGVAEMEEREEQLLALVKSWMAKIPVPELDVLIVDEMGKNISGSGMDLKIINRSPHAHYNPWPDTPRIERIFARDLSPASYGNAVGVGVADVVTDRLVHKIDWTASRINALTSNVLATVRTPTHFPSDRECLDFLWPSVGKFRPGDVTFAWIRNTLALEWLAVSENLYAQILANPLVSIESEPLPLTFDSQGNLTGPLTAAAPAAVFVDRH